MLFAFNKSSKWFLAFRRKTLFPCGLSIKDGDAMCIPVKKGLMSRRTFLISSLLINAVTPRYHSSTPFLPRGNPSKGHVGEVERSLSLTIRQRTHRMCGQARSPIGVANVAIYSFSDPLRLIPHTLHCSTSFARSITTLQDPIWSGGGR